MEAIVGLWWFSGGEAVVIFCWWGLYCGLVAIVVDEGRGRRRRRRKRGFGGGFALLGCGEPS